MGEWVGGKGDVHGGGEGGGREGGEEEEELLEGVGVL